jgi:hypothetical protein
MKTRRAFLKMASYAPFIASYPTLSSAASPFTGKFVVTVQAEGAWDVTLFCDPKENQSGEPVITNWSKNNETQTSGNIRYAPFANNETFFKKHASKMLVINGVDSQTNAHTIGETVNWSGRTAAGYPTLTALYSAATAPALPMSYVSFGGFSRAENIIRATQLGWSVNQIGELLRPNYSNNRPVIQDELWTMIKKLHINSSSDSLASQSILGGNRRTIEAYVDSMRSMDPLMEFGEVLPGRDEIEPRGERGFLRQQAQFAVQALRSGVSVAADLSIGGFDSHRDNDPEQLACLSELTDGIDYLWDAAEEAGIADRLLVIVGSDFSRTPYYNSGEGKDHWPYGSYIIMEKGAKYTNRMIAGTDEVQNVVKIDPRTLQPSGFGTKMETSHVHEALRDYLGLSNTSTAQIFPFNNAEKFNFFG